jgi:hypothetical protein
MKLQSKGIKNPADALGQCAIQSTGYAKKYNTGLVRVNSWHYPGREHWAIYNQETNEVIDLTARQFTVTVPAKFVAQLEDWLDEAAYWLGDSLVYSLFDNPDTMKPSYESQWIREEIDPHEFVREEAGLNELRKQNSGAEKYEAFIKKEEGAKV